ncbi:MAG: sodium/proline symporter [Verrucomicrobia bacterium]|nr:sodium/proline symporter [Lachnospiraceae bacterium]MBR4248632.1 sodium/proline symporter [Verrucomicrobiota bacterium]
MTTAQALIFVAIIAYLSMTLLVGIYFSRKGSGDSSDEFYIGGRKLGPVVTAMSAEASDMSSYLLMGLPGLAYFAGVAEVGWTIIGLAVGTYLNFLLVAKLLRRYSAKIEAMTIPEFFSKRYEDEKHVLSLIAALIILVFFVPYTASGFKAVGTLFNSLFGMDYHIAMIGGAIIIITYTVLGGFLAVSTTDLIQSIFMSVALVIIVFFGIAQAGGMGAVVAGAQALPGYLDLTKGYIWATGEAGEFGILSIVSTLAWGLGYFGMPHILLRFMAIRHEDELKVSRRIAAVWVVISMAVAVFIGVIGYSVSVAGKIPFLGTNAEAETIIIQLATLMSEHGTILALVAGIIMAGILAATMSTADSQLLAASSSVSQDILTDFLGIKMENRKSMLAARLTVVIIALIALILAWNPDSSVFRVVSFAWAGFGATFGPSMLLALFWKRSNKYGAIAGMATGGIMVFVWKFLIAPLGGVFGIYELLPAFLVTLVVNVVVSLLTPAPSKEALAIFDEVHTK